MKKLLILFILVSLLIPTVFALDSLSIRPSIPSIYIPPQTAPVYNVYIPTITTPSIIKVCDQSAIKCQNNVFMFCDNNSWKTRKTCAFDELCDEKSGCVKKQTVQPNLNIIKPVPELKIVENIPRIVQPNIAQFCHEGDIKCSSIRTNAIMICQDTQWSIKQKCAFNEECVTGQGCVAKQLSPSQLEVLKPISKIVQAQKDTCEETATGVNGVFRSRTYNYDATCQGNLLFTYSCGNEGHYSMEQERCDENEFCDNQKGCLLKQTPYLNIAIKKPELVLGKCNVGDKKCSSDSKEVLICSGGKWGREQICGDNYVCENNRCVPKTEIAKIIPVKRPIKVIKDAGEETSSDDQQLANLDIQDTLQKMDKYLKTLSNVSKEVQELTIAIIKSITGKEDNGKEEKTQSKKEVSKEELNKIIKDVEAQQETLRDRRQMALTSFQNFDQKMNQLYNVLVDVLKTMDEIRGTGVSSRSSALTSEERAKKEETVTNDIKKINEAKKEINTLLVQITKEAKNAKEEDKKYYLEKLEEYDKIGEELADSLSDLVDQSTALSHYGRDERGINEKTEQDTKQMDFDGLIQFILRESYLDNQQDLEVYAEKVKYFNDQKKQIREELSRNRKEITKENVENLLSKDKKLKDELVEAAKKYQNLINPKREFEVGKKTNLEQKETCSELEPVTISFPVKNYLKFTDCELLAQRELLVDVYINKLMSLANQCMNLAKENMNSYDKKIQKIMDHVLQTEPTAKMSLLMKSIPELSKSGLGSSIDEDEQHKIKGVLDSLTNQVETLCELANNVNKNALGVCKDMDNYIYVGVTEEGKQNYLQILNKQKEYAKNHFDLAQKNYAMISAKQKLENNIYVEGVVYHCKNGYSKEDLSEIFSEPEPSTRDSLIDTLLNKIKQGNVDAVSQLLILVSKQSRKEQEDIAKKLVSAMNDLDKKQEQLTKQLASLGKDKSQAQKLADVNDLLPDLKVEVSSRGLYAAA
ncbi:hypothetical protein HZA97_01330 [Candidatus Woesearchaeota archaeon]|nr:hypothetical protein [Candidatus Woesearchaeota archaeon]